jgi:hypothetical protein
VILADVIASVVRQVLNRCSCNREWRIILESSEWLQLYEAVMKRLLQSAKRLCSMCRRQFQFRWEFYRHVHMARVD